MHMNHHWKAKPDKIRKFWQVIIQSWACHKINLVPQMRNLRKQHVVQHICIYIQQTAEYCRKYEPY